jgi:archaemetzincin
MSLVASVALLFCALSGDPESGMIAIQPLGYVPTTALNSVKSGLERVYGLQAVVLPTAPLPKSAFYAPRNRYRADRLIESLAVQRRYTKVIGITTRDISATKGENHDWGVFGLGRMPGRVCISSSFRLGGSGKKSRNKRLAEVAVHEIGHTFGLPHCLVARCVMADAKGTVRTVDASTGNLCANCRRNLAVKR